MLGVRTYTSEYLEQCRAKVAADLASYRALVGQVPAGATVDAFERSYFTNMALVLDSLFVHRLRTVEGKDGNPLNELRMVCESIAENGGVFRVEKSIKMPPAKSVLKLQPGDDVRLDADGFERLAEAVFAEMERKFI